MTRVFFTDRDLGTKFPEILANAGLTVQRHRDHFPPDCADEAWLEEIGKRGWVALTHDRRIRYKPNERAAVVRHRVTLLVIVGNAPFPDLAHAFVSTMPRVVAFLAANPPPVIGKVYRPTPTDLSSVISTPGRLERWYPMN
ncbi:MAG: hypothetical protein ABI647_20925 [Gemmatimonadota bacterium]